MRIASLRMAVLALSFVAARAAAQTDQPEVVAEIVRGRHDPGYHRCRVRLRVLTGDRMGDEFDAEVACYTFMLHQLQRRGRLFRVRLEPRPRSPAFEAHFIGAEIFTRPSR